MSNNTPEGTQIKALLRQLSQRAIGVSSADPELSIYPAHLVGTIACTLRRQGELVTRKMTHKNVRHFANEALRAAYVEQVQRVPVVKSGAPVTTTTGRLGNNQAWLSQPAIETPRTRYTICPPVLGKYVSFGSTPAMGLQRGRVSP
jgi:hypothetical protein